MARLPGAGGVGGAAVNIDQYMATMRRLETYCRENCYGRHWLEWPKVGDMARRYRITQDAICELAQDSERLDLIVGMLAGSDAGDLDKRDYRIEYVPEDDE